MPLWSVRVDADTGGAYDEALDTALRERLAGYSPAAGAGHLAGRAMPGRVSVQLAVDAATLHQAAEEARREVTSVLRDHGHTARLARMDVMSWEEFEAELEGAPPEIVGIQEIADILEVSRQRAHQLVKRDDFPEPLARLASGAIWSGATVRRWAATWERRTGRPPKSATG